MKSWMMLAVCERKIDLVWRDWSWKMALEFRKLTPLKTPLKMKCKLISIAKLPIRTHTDLPFKILCVCVKFSHSHTQTDKIALAIRSLFSIESRRVPRVFRANEWAWPSRASKTDNYFALYNYNCVNFYQKSHCFIYNDLNLVQLNEASLQLQAQNYNGLSSNQTILYCVTSTKN